MVFTGQTDASGSHFTDNLSVGIYAQRHKHTHLGEGGEIPILIGLQDRDYMASLRMQAGEKFGSHALPIHDYSCNLAALCVLFIPLQKCGDAHGEMLISSMSGDKQRMALLVVQ
jgi:hypothetical protein